MIKRYLHAFARYGGLVTVCIEWLAVVLFYAIRPADFNGQNPISYYASFPETRLIFSVCLTIAAASFWTFTTFHLPKYYNVPVRLFAASMLGYAALALIPFDPQNAVSEAVHNILALSFAATYLVGIYIMGRRNQARDVRRVSYATSVLSGLILVIFVLTPKDSNFILLFEVISVFIGQVWAVWISFHSFKVDRDGLG